MEFIKKSFKNRTIGFWLGLSVAAVALIIAILFMILRISDTEENFFLVSNDAFLIIAIICLFIGALSQALVMFTEFKFAPLIPVALYSVALGSYAYCAMFQIADLFTGITFFGGSVGFTIAFLVIFALCAIAAIVSCFMKQRKTPA